MQARKLIAERIYPLSCHSAAYGFDGAVNLFRDFSLGELPCTTYSVKTILFVLSQTKQRILCSLSESSVLLCCE